MPKAGIQLGNIAKPTSGMQSCSVATPRTVRQSRHAQQRLIACPRTFRLLSCSSASACFCFCWSICSEASWILSCWFRSVSACSSERLCGNRPSLCVSAFPVSLSLSPPTRSLFPYCIEIVHSDRVWLQTHTFSFFREYYFDVNIITSKIAWHEGNKRKLLE